MIHRRRRNTEQRAKQSLFMKSTLTTISRLHIPACVHVQQEKRTEPSEGALRSHENINPACQRWPFLWFSMLLNVAFLNYQENFQPSSAGCIHPPADASAALPALADILNTENAHPGVVLPGAQDFNVRSGNSRFLNDHPDTEAVRFWTTGAALFNLLTNLSWDPPRLDLILLPTCAERKQRINLVYSEPKWRR